MFSCILEYFGSSATYVIKCLINYLKKLSSMYYLRTSNILKYLLRQESRSISLSKKRMKTMARSCPNTRAMQARGEVEETVEETPEKVTVTKKVAKTGVMMRDDIAMLKVDRSKICKGKGGGKGANVAKNKPDEEVVINKPCVIGDAAKTKKDVDCNISTGADGTNEVTKGTNEVTMGTVTVVGNKTDDQK